MPGASVADPDGRGHSCRLLTSGAAPSSSLQVIILPLETAPGLLVGLDFWTACNHVTCNANLELGVI